MTCGEGIKSYVEHPAAEEHTIDVQYLVGVRKPGNRLADNPISQPFHNMTRKKNQSSDRTKGRSPSYRTQYRKTPEFYIAMIPLKAIASATTRERGSWEFSSHRPDAPS